MPEAARKRNRNTGAPINIPITAAIITTMGSATKKFRSTPNDGGRNPAKVTRWPPVRIAVKYAPTAKNATYPRSRRPA